MTKQIFGHEPTHGRRYNLEVSRGAIKKLAKDRSDKQDVKCFASFLGTVLMRETNINVSKEAINIADFHDEQKEVEVLIVNTHEYLKAQSMIDVVSLPSLGTIKITHHAVDRYTEYLNSLNDEVAHNPLKSLLKRLRSPRLVKQKLNEKIIRHKIRKYGKNAQLEQWGQDTSSFHYTLVQGGKEKEKQYDIRTLVTVFVR